MNSTLRRAALAATAVVFLFGATACSSDDDNPSSNDTSGAMTSPGDQTFGPGCSAIPTEGAGSFDGMSGAPVATAASNNPLLTTLVAAVTEAGLVDTLNGAEALTVFAPTDDAFAAIPKKDLDAVLADKDLLTSILAQHVIVGQLSPDQLAGTHETFGGGTLKITGSGEDFLVGGEKAHILCGNIPTANATVYVIDTVLMP